MGIEFRLGGQDHKKVEDFLAQRPKGVSAIVLDTKAAKHQRGAAEAATEIGTAVYFDPATERLTEPGFELLGVPYYPATPYDLDELAQSQPKRTALVAGVIQAHPTFATSVTPPHFFVRDERSARLNVSLAEETIHEHGLSVRATLVLSSRYPLESVPELAKEYYRAGVRSLELRISPLGGEDEGVRKIRYMYAVLEVFKSAGLTVTLGFSGNIGQTALSLGHVAAYSVGIGMRESVNYAGQISRQKQPPKLLSDDDEDKGGGGPTSGIYLPGLALTVRRKLGAIYLANTDIRTRIGCRLGACGTSVNGPQIDPRGHYLHARTAEVSQLLAAPAPWRAKMEVDRLTRARAMRILINSKHKPTEAGDFKVRTLESLIADIAVQQKQQTA